MAWPVEGEPGDEGFLVTRVAGCELCGEEGGGLEGFIVCRGRIAMQTKKRVGGGLLSKPTHGRSAAFAQPPLYPTST